MNNLTDTLRGILTWHSTLLTRVEREAIEEAIKGCEDYNKSTEEFDRHKAFYELIKPLPDCNICGAAKECKYKPRLGAATRINCPLFQPKEAFHEKPS